MSESSSGQKPPGRVSKAMSRLASWPARLSTAGKAAWSMAAFLVLATVIVWAVFLSEPGHVAPRHAFTVWRILAVVTLLMLIPLATYQVVRLWLEGDRSRFPELDFAWNAGLEAIRKSGLSLDELPIFVVLGSPGDRTERAMAGACGEDFRVRGVPEGPSPLHWYVGSDRAYVFLTEPSWVSGLAALAARRTQSAAIPPDALAALAAVGHAPTPRGTVSLGDYIATSGAGREPAASATGDAYQGTLSIGALAAARAIPADANRTLTGLSPSAVFEQPIVLSAQESAQKLDQLEYVARKLRLVRRPLCAVNGILVLIPFDLVRGEANEKEELARAVRSDLTTFQNAVGVRAPVTALLIGMEQEPGFQELVRRVGRERAAAQRFGRRYDVRALPTPAEMTATSAHVCGAFEDWIYSLFREEDAIARPGTARLYGLLCRVRCHLKDPLAELLARGFGYDPALRSDDLPFLFSGCYVAATGETEDRRAFVKGVFEKLDAEQEDIEWTPASLAVEKRHRRLIGVLATLDVALVASLVGMAVYRIVW